MKKIVVAALLLSMSSISALDLSKDVKRAVANTTSAVKSGVGTALHLADTAVPYALCLLCGQAVWNKYVASSSETATSLLAKVEASTPTLAGGVPTIAAHFATGAAVAAVALFALNNSATGSFLRDNCPNLSAWVEKLSSSIGANSTNVAA